MARAEVLNRSRHAVVHDRLDARIHWGSRELDTEAQDAKLVGDHDSPINLREASDAVNLALYTIERHQPNVIATRDIGHQRSQRVVVAPVLSDLESPLREQLFEAADAVVDPSARRRSKAWSAAHLDRQGAGRRFRALGDGPQRNASSWSSMSRFSSFSSRDARRRHAGS